MTQDDAQARTAPGAFGRGARAPGREELGTRTGFDPGFLSSRLPVPVPVPRPSGDGTRPDVVLLPYTHFTVTHRLDRRLAAATVVAIDGADLVQVDRDGSDFWLDPRLPAAAQTGEQVYAGNALDRGHLVRRADPVWGPDAAQASTDTFAFPSIAPQYEAFNQGQDLWAGLEDHLLAHAATHDQRLVVVTGPLLDPGDPSYRGVQVPLRFYKVAAYLDPDTDPAGPPALAATGYLLDQSDLIEDFLLAQDPDRAGAPARAPQLGAYRTYQVPITDLAALTGLDLGPLPAADRLPVTTTQTQTQTRTQAAGHDHDAAGSPSTLGPGAWRALADYDDIVT